MHGRLEESRGRNSGKKMQSAKSESIPRIRKTTKPKSNIFICKSKSVWGYVNVNELIWRQSWAVSVRQDSAVIYHCLVVFMWLKKKLTPPWCMPVGWRARGRSSTGRRPPDAVDKCVEGDNCCSVDNSND